MSSASAKRVKATEQAPEQAEMDLREVAMETYGKILGAAVVSPEHFACVPGHIQKLGAHLLFRGIVALKEEFQDAMQDVRKNKSFLVPYFPGESKYEENTIAEINRLHTEVQEAFNALPAGKFFGRVQLKAFNDRFHDLGERTEAEFDAAVAAFKAAKAAEKAEKAEKAETAEAA